MNSASTLRRYEDVASKKESGSTYTPPELAEFVARQILLEWDGNVRGPLRILDPAVGEGELLYQLMRLLPRDIEVEAYGYDRDANALLFAKSRLEGAYSNISVHLACADFLEVVGHVSQQSTLFDSGSATCYDLIIANPPYVRTQILGADVSQGLALRFGLRGRVDLYHAFILAICSVLSENGVLGIIVSNRFMTTKTGSSVRQTFEERLKLRHVWDLGDTKLFDAAVLPAVIIAEGNATAPKSMPSFTSIYQTKSTATIEAPCVTAALNSNGIVAIPGGRIFDVQKGSLDTTKKSGGIWRVATTESDSWLRTVKDNTWANFNRLGKIRVGVKTCADSVFVRKDWHTFAEGTRPELLRRLTTHHIGRQFRASSIDDQRFVLYPHETVNGRRRAVDLVKYPNSQAYLEANRESLEARDYLIAGGRNWFELWVPQDPSAWSQTKLVFRDISEEPCFWIDKDQTIVNGDCYWLACNDSADEDLLWLAVGVANSSFIKLFYDRSFNNKLYAGRRRYISQYVENFPLPNPESQIGLEIITSAKQAYEFADTPLFVDVQSRLNELVSQAFGVLVKEPQRQAHL